MPKKACLNNHHTVHCVLCLPGGAGGQGGSGGRGGSAGHAYGEGTVHDGGDGRYFVVVEQYVWHALYGVFAHLPRCLPAFVHFST